MLTLKAMADRVSDRINITSAPFQVKIKRWLEDRYNDLWDRIEWEEAITSKESGVTFTATEAFMILPSDVDEIIVLVDRAQDNALAVMSPTQLWRNFATTADTAGSPITYHPAGTVQYSDQPDDVAVLKAKSSSASDTTQTVRFEFLSGGVKITETVTLNGTILQATTATCDIGGFISASKSDNTVGNVTITGGVVAKTLLVIPMNEATVYFRQIRLRSVPNAADTLTIVYKRKRRRLINDEDTPDFNCYGALVLGAYADALAEQKQHGKFQIFEDRYERAVNNLISKSREQGEYFEQAIPHIEQRGLNIGLDAVRFNC